MLKSGKIHENVLKRSVIKEIKNYRQELISGPRIAGDSSHINMGHEQMAVSTASVTFETSDAVFYAIANACNNIAVSNCEAVGVMLTVLLPEEEDERTLKTIMRQADDACKELNIQIIGGHTEVTSAVNRAVISVTALGKSEENDIISSSGAKAGDDVIITKWIGLEGTAMLAKEKKAELLGHFSEAFIERACDFTQCIFVRDDVKSISKLNISAMHDISTGGIYSALWEIAEASKAGLDIDLLSIPIRQETVEICEVFGLNPYELHSGGSIIITSPCGKEVVAELEKNGIPSTIVGKITDSADRLIRNDDEIRYLEPPKSDELIKVL